VETRPCVEALEAEEVETTAAAAAGGGAGAVVGVPF